MKYKVGDKVRVRKDLELDKKYADVLYSLDMDEFKNKECVITKVGNKSGSYICDMLKEIEKELNIE